MKKFFALIALIALTACAAMLAEPSPSAAQPQDKDLEGMDVLTRGPLHEAYAAPEALDPKPAPIVPKEPPQPIEEMPPEQKPEGSHVIWISGYWAWDDETAQYLWISGFWRDVPPGKRWIAGHWTTVAGGGWQWASGCWADEAQTEVNYVPAPPPTLETGPSTAAPDADQFYSPGCWVYVERKYRWRPGFWLRNRADLVYVPAHYVWTSAGYIFVDGYWDYQLTRRGLLFCPIRFTANVFLRPGWRLASRFIVYPEVIVSALFVRIDLHRYCFGDYFDARFLQHGFVPWVDYRLHRNIPEPLFRQYAWSNRKEVNWERDLRKVYDDRRTGIALRPPASMAEQQRFLRELAANKGVKVGERMIAVADVKTAERNLHMVSTLAAVDKRVVLKTLTKEQHAQVLKTVAHHAEVVQVRKVTEAKIVKENPVFKPSDAHQVVKLPAIPPHLVAPKTVMMPTAPVIPKHEERVVPKYEPPKSPKLGTKPLHGRIDPPLPEMRAEARWIDGRPDVNRRFAEAKDRWRRM
jgi:WXXGXW repeat (2 copies)